VNNAGNKQVRKFSNVFIFRLHGHVHEQHVAATFGDADFKRVLLQWTCGVWFWYLFTMLMYTICMRERRVLLRALCRNHCN